MTAARACECRQLDCHACEIEGVKEWLMVRGLRVVSEDERRVLIAAEVWFDSWECSAGEPPEDLPSERALYRAELARRRAER